MSRLLINSEYRFSRAPDGSIWTETAFPYSYWEKYLAGFSGVQIFARVHPIDQIPPFFKRVDGPSVFVRSLPYYIGSLQFVSKWFSIKKILKAVLTAGDAVILISPSPISLIFENVLAKKKIAYGVEVLGDPNEVFSASGVQHPLRLFLRWWLTSRQKKMVARASAVSYVTQISLQKNYPSSANSFSIGISNIDLQPSHVLSHPLAVQKRIENDFCIVAVGSLEQLYKGADVLLKAIAILKARGHACRLRWVGGGRFLNELVDLSKNLGLQESVCFLGQIASGEAVRLELDQADLFVLPSRTEGLPRALVEAMARGLPCLGSRVGGIPELLEENEMFESEDAFGAAERIEKVIRQPALRQTMSQKNIKKSQNYLSDRLDKKRLEFFVAVRRAAEIARSS